MNGRSRHPAAGLALAGGMALLAGSAWAQDDGRAATRSLNAGPAASSPAIGLQARPPAQEPPRRTLEDALAEMEGSAASDRGAEGLTLDAGETEPPPIPMTLGYYVRGDLDCDQAWPGDGDLAWATPTAFTLDYGGCEPGPWLQTGPNSWREEQRCVTESGGDTGGYSVTYEVIGTDTVMRNARLAFDGSVEEDLWTYCRTQDVSENARFAP